MEQDVFTAALSRRRQLVVDADMEMGGNSAACASGAVDTIGLVSRGFARGEKSIDDGTS